MEPISRDQLASVAADARERWHVPGIAVGTWSPASQQCAAAGVCELGSDRPVTPETVFRVASITKPFVATLAMTLVQEGLLALDEPPPATSTRATTRQLLGNAGGLKSEWEDRPDFGDGDDALARLAEREPPLLPLEPGELFSYANAGFWLVGAACAERTGTTFEAAMHRRVLEPLQLAATGFAASAAATGHEQLEPGADEHRPVEDTYPRARRPSGGLWSTVGDLLRFARHHLGGPGPLSDESRAEMQRPLTAGPGFEYGLGWFLTRRGGRPALEHTGSAFGFQSLLVLVPGAPCAFAALTNSSRGQRAIDDIARSVGLEPDDPEPVELSEEQLAPFAGLYRTHGSDFAISVDDGALRVEETAVNPLTGAVERAPAVRARPVGAREFEIVEGDARGERFDFPRDGLARFLAVAVRDE